MTSPHLKETRAAVVVPMFEIAKRIYVIVSTHRSSGGRGGGFPSHLAFYSTKHREWVPLCGAWGRNHITFAATLQLEAEDVSCLRCAPLLPLVAHIEVTPGEYDPREAPVRVLKKRMLDT